VYAKIYDFPETAILLVFAGFRDLMCEGCLVSDGHGSVFDRRRKRTWTLLYAAIAHGIPQTNGDINAPLPEAARRDYNGARGTRFASKAVMEVQA